MYPFQNFFFFNLNDMCVLACMHSLVSVGMKRCAYTSCTSMYNTMQVLMIIHHQPVYTQNLRRSRGPSLWQSPHQHACCRWKKRGSVPSSVAWPTATASLMWEEALPACRPPTIPSLTCLGTGEGLVALNTV